MQDGYAAGAALIAGTAADAAVMGSGAILAFTFIHRKVIDVVVHTGRIEVFTRGGVCQNIRKWHQTQQENQE